MTGKSTMSRPRLRQIELCDVLPKVKNPVKTALYQETHGNDILVDYKFK